MYKQCTVYGVYDVRLGESKYFRHFVGKNFLYTAVVAFRRYGVTLLGVKRGGDPHICLNPGLKHEMGEGDICYYMWHTREEYTSVSSKMATVGVLNAGVMATGVLRFNQNQLWSETKDSSKIKSGWSLLEESEDHRGQDTAGTYTTIQPNKREEEEAQKSGEEAQRSGEETQRSGEEAQRSGEEAQRSGEEAQRSGEEAQRSVEEAQRSGEEAQTSAYITDIEEQQLILGPEAAGIDLIDESMQEGLSDPRRHFLADDVEKQSSHSGGSSHEGKVAL